MAAIVQAPKKTSKTWAYRNDPFYRALPAEIADLEWQCVEANFQADLQRAEVTTSAIDQAREATAIALRGAK